VKQGLSLVALLLLGVFATFAAVPFYEASRDQVEYAGPGREDPPPADLDHVAIGWFGPSDPAHPQGGDLWSAARQAVEEANLEGGFEGRPFRLIPAWSPDPWGNGVAQVARMVYDDGVWAIVGSIDGATTHLAEQVVAKARLPLISPASTDESVNFANLAWMFSCLPGDDLLADRLVETLAERVEPRRWALITGTDHDARAAATALSKSVGRQGIAPWRHLEIAAGVSPETVIGELAGSELQAVVILAGAEESAGLAVALRARFADAQIFGGPSMARREFAERAGAAAEGVLFPFPCDTSAGSRFPDCAAAQTYDATRLLIESIRNAGLNRARIRDAIEAISPWTGEAGRIEWDPVGRNRRPVSLATIRAGRVTGF